MSNYPISVERPLILGSASPRRRQILRDLGIAFLGAPASIDETPLPQEGAEEYVRRITRAKAQSVLEGVSDFEKKGMSHCGLVLVADTTVVLNGAIVGKPRDQEEAFRTVASLAGRVHRVLTRYALGRWPERELVCERTVASEVMIRAASERELRDYAGTGEGLDKAGAYAVQGLGAFLVREIRGSYSNVVGLPACEVVEDLAKLGALVDYPRGTLLA